MWFLALSALSSFLIVAVKASVVSVASFPTSNSKRKARHCSWTSIVDNMPLPRKLQQTKIKIIALHHLSGVDYNVSKGNALSIINTKITLVPTILMASFQRLNLLCWPFHLQLLAQVFPLVGLFSSPTTCLSFFTHGPFTSLLNDMDFSSNILTVSSAASSTLSHPEEQAYERLLLWTLH